MTRLELETRALLRIGENPSAPAFTSIAEARAALDRAQRFFNLFTLSIEATGTLPVAGWTVNPRTTFPRYLGTLRVRTAAGVKIRPASREQLAAANPSWATVTAAAASRYSARGWDSIAFSPGFTGNATLTYVAEPVALASDNAEPEIAPAYHAVLVDFAISDLRSKEGGGEFHKTVAELSRFVEAMLAEIGHRRKLYLAESYDLVPREWKRKELMEALAEVALAD